MLFPPELQKQVRVKSRERVPAMNRDVAATAEGDVQGRAILAGLPVMDEQVRIRKAELAAAIAGENAFPLAAEKAERVPAPVIAGAAQALGEEGVTAAGAAPKNGLGAGEETGAVEMEPGTGHSRRIHYRSC
jgi:hypothetical protein